jgi:E3 ubiquitin-protein ligase DCST1
MLHSRKPRVGDSTSGSGGRSRRGSRFAACWCRVAGSVAVGLVSGALTYSIMTYDLGYGLLPAAVCAAIVIILISAFLVASRLFRCVVTLVMPSLSTACGRAAICLIVAHLVLGGPVHNVARNAGEAVRSLTCSAELALNRTAGLLRPFDAMMRELDKTVARLEGAAADVSRGLRPLDEGLDAVEMDVYNARTQLLGTRRVRICCASANYTARNVDIL